MARVVHFEIHVDNPQRAIRFYQDVFGWEDWRRGWLACAKDTERNIIGVMERDTTAK